MSAIRPPRRFQVLPPDAQWVFRTLLRRKLVILLPALLFAIIAAAVAVNVPNRYTATAMIRFDPRGEKSSHGDATASNIFDKESLNSQRELLQAQRMAQRVITQLDLVADPEFNESLKPHGRISRAMLISAKSLLDYFKPLIDRIEAALPSEAKPQPTDRVNAKVLGRFLRALSVALKQDTRVLSISFTSSDPEKAANIANAVAQNFMAWQIADRQDALRRTSQWLAKEVAELQARVQRAREENRRLPQAIEGARRQRRPDDRRADQRPEPRHHRRQDQAQRGRSPARAGPPGGCRRQCGGDAGCPAIQGHPGPDRSRSPGEGEGHHSGTGTRPVSSAPHRGPVGARGHRGEDQSRGKPHRLGRRERGSRRPGARDADSGHGRRLSAASRRRQRDRSSRCAE